MLENEMQFRMDLEKLKAQVAEYERRLEDQEDVGDPPLAVEAGSGIEVQAVAGAWRVSATAATAESDPQWGCSVVASGASYALRVRSGSLGWGGAHVAVWPSGDAVSRAVYGDIALAVPVGETWFVVWYTTAAPVPIAACPKNPTQTTEPCAECDGCTVGEPGDPASFVPDRGNVGIVSTLDRQAEWTDMRVLATVECTAEGVYKVVQIQTAEIAVNAIVYPGESGEGEAPADEDTPDPEACAAADAVGNFPSDVDDAEGPDDPEDPEDPEGPGGGGGNDHEFPSKTGPCW